MYHETIGLFSLLEDQFAYILEPENWKSGEMDLNIKNVLYLYCTVYRNVQYIYGMPVLDLLTSIALNVHCD